MDRVINVEEARKKLGQLVEEADNRPVILTRRGRAAVLLSLERYEQLEHLANIAAGRELEAALESLHAAAAQNGVAIEVVDEAVAWARSGQAN